VPKLSLTRHLAALGAATSLLLATGAGSAQAAAAGIVPPRNPASNCNAGEGVGIPAINACRAQENVGPLRLPSNWDSLSSVQQGFVLINLERVNRGLPAIVGLSGSLNTLASAGAASGNDPSFPAGGFVGGGAIWAGAPSVIAADYLWMYADGPGGNNLDCGSGSDSGCWGHRDIILWSKPGTLVAGGGYASGGGGISSAYVVLSGYSTGNLTFTWAGELKYFATTPGIEPLSGKAASAAKRHKKKPKRGHHHKAKHGAQSDSSSSASSASAGGPTITFG
jgi:hypothetical protein